MLSACYLITLSALTSTLGGIVRPRLELLDLHLDLVKMRLAIRSGVDSRDFRYSAPMFIAVLDSVA